MKMSSIAIITARGGSKRIPNKNFKDFCGKPIITYSIEAALNSGVFDEVMVSTDSETIANIAIEHGANVPFLRSDKTSNDFATTRDVIKEVLEKYSEKKIVFDEFCCLYPTAPFVTAEKLSKAASILRASDSYSLMSVVGFSFPPQRGLILKNGNVAYKYPEYAMSRSQDLEKMFHDAGQFYFCRVDAFLEENTLVTSKTIPFELPEEEVQDIDNYSDWVIAELKYKACIEGKNNE